MAAQRKYGDDVREAIHQLVNENGHTATEAMTTLQTRFPEIPAVQRVREIAREERKNHRPDLTTQPKDQQLQRLIAGIVKAVDLALHAAEHDAASIDADKLLKLAQTVRQIEPLLKPETPQQRSNEAPKGLLARINTQQSAPQDNEDHNQQHSVSPHATSSRAA